MSTASKVTQIIFLQKSGVYMPLIQSNQGDLYQEYEGTESSPTNIAPSFADLKPILSFILTSSRTLEGLVTPSKVDWYFNDTLLTFDGNNVSTNNFNGETGHFTKLSPNANSGYHGLQITKDLVKASLATACTIKGVATVSVGNTSDTIQYVYPIPVFKGSASGFRVTIAAGDNKFFTLRGKNDSCILKAVVRNGNTEVTQDLAYAWYKLVDGAWSKLTYTGAQITVTNDMVDTVGQFKVEVSSKSQVIGLDTQTVTDASDPYDMILNPVPSDETIREKGDTVTYTPMVITRGQTDLSRPAAGMENMKFYFVLTDSAGNLLNTGDSTTSRTTYTVTWAYCEQAGGNVSLTITTEV